MCLLSVQTYHTKWILIYTSANMYLLSASHWYCLKAQFVSGQIHNEDRGCFLLISEMKMRTITGRGSGKVSCFSIDTPDDILSCQQHQTITPVCTKTDFSRRPERWQSPFSKQEVTSNSLIYFILRSHRNCFRSRRYFIVN